MSARLEVASFGDEHLHDASVLLAARHARQRLVEPLLSPAFEEPDAARIELEAAWRSDGASGAVAHDSGRLVGYLIGAPRHGTAWGPNVWVGPSGHATEAAETVRDLYAPAAATWVANGATSHYAVVPATDPGLLDAWSRLEFGQQHGLGIREVPDQPAQPAHSAQPGRARVRIANVGDDVWYSPRMSSRRISSASSTVAMRTRARPGWAEWAGRAGWSGTSRIPRPCC